MNRTTVQRVGQNAAYTFKGLMKSADILQLYQTVLTVIPFVLGAVALGNKWSPPVWGVASLIAGFLLVLSSRSFGAIEQYRENAMRFKKLHERCCVEFEAGTPTEEVARKISEEYSRLERELSGTPILVLGYLWARITVSEEMASPWNSECESHG